MSNQGKDHVFAIDHRQKEEFSRISAELRQIEADREALFISRQPPLPTDPAQSRQFFKELRSITERYQALERQCRQLYDAVHPPRAHITLVRPRNH